MGKIITLNNLNRLWQNGVMNIKEALEGRIDELEENGATVENKLNTYDDIMANEVEGYIPDAIAVKEGFSQMKTSFQDGCNTIVNALVDKGVTPEDNSPASIAYAINSLMEKKIFSVSFKVTVDGYAKNNAGTVTATGNITYTLKDDGTLIQSDLAKSSSSAISYISGCNITGITLSDLVYDATLDEVTFKISTGISAYNGAGTARGNASQSFKISNMTDVSAIDSMSKTSSTVTQINTITINKIVITVL